MHRRTAWLSLLLGACASRGDCDPASCGLSDREARPMDEAAWATFGPLLDNYRRGPQPVDSVAVGMCLDAACTVSRPPLAGVLPTGTWRLRAEFLLPELGRENWHFELHELCEVQTYDGPKKTGERDETQVLTLDVTATPGQRAGNPAWITRPSPDPVGDRLCGWRLTASSGQRAYQWEGVYQIPGVGRPVPAPWGDPQTDEAPAPDAPASSGAPSSEDLGVLRVMDGKPEDGPRAANSVLPSAPEAAPNPTPTTVKPPKPTEGRAPPPAQAPAPSPAQGTP